MDGPNGCVARSDDRFTLRIRLTSPAKVDGELYATLITAPGNDQSTTYRQKPGDARRRVGRHPEDRHQRS